MTPLGTATILRGDARALPLPDASVDLIVTSPPFYGLRSYTDGGEHYDGQIGAEATPREYIASLIDCTREWVRVLKPTGSIFVNLGDKYNSAASGQNGTNATTLDPARGPKMYHGERGRTVADIQPKSLMLLPERYRIACLDDLGLIARAVILWDKVNGLPESVTDRVGRSHEDWVHLTKQPRYYSAVDRIRTPPSGYHRPNTSDRGMRGSTTKRRTLADTCNPLGALPGSVWQVATEPLIIPDHIAHAACCGGVKRAGCEDGLSHYAAFPTEWPRQLIEGWSPAGICTACGEGRRPVAVRSKIADRPGRVQGRQVDALTGGHGQDGRAGSRYAAVVTLTGEACACPEPTAPTRPAVVLDPFGGTGTVALVAMALGRHGISGDRSADYCRLATWRTTDPGQLAKALQVPKPPKQSDGQMDLFASSDQEGAA